jgi:hypothetical protein
MDYDKLANEIASKSNQKIDYDALANEVSQKKPASFLSRVGSGFVDPVIGLNQLLYNALPDVGQRGIDALTNKAAEFGLTTPMPEGGYNEFVRQREQTIQNRSPEGVDWGRVLGNVASPVNAIPALAPIKAATTGARIGLGAGLGAFGGATTPVEDENYGVGLAKNVALGAAVGGAGSGLVEGAARAIKPLISDNELVKALQKSAPSMTPGQTLGGGFGRFEEKLTAIPILGDLIAKRRNEALEQYNTANFNAVGRPIGFKTDKVGFEALAETDEAVTDAFDKAVKQARFINFDDKFFKGLARSVRRAESAPDTGESVQAVNKQISIMYKKMIGRLKSKTTTVKKKTEPDFDDVDFFEEIPSGTLDDEGQLLLENLNSNFEKLASETGNDDLIKLIGRTREELTVSPSEFAKKGGEIADWGDEITKPTIREYQVKQQPAIGYEQKLLLGSNQQQPPKMKDMGRLRPINPERTKSILSDVWKTIDAGIGRAARSSAKNPVVADSLRGLQKQWKDVLVRSNPQQADLFNRADKAFVNMLKLENATKLASKQEGVFTPNQALRSSEKFQTSKRASRRKLDPMAQAAIVAERHLGNKVPDSGTAGRLMAGMTGAGVTGGLAATNPLSLLPPLALAMMYTKPGVKIANSLLLNRGNAAGKTALAFKQASPYVGFAAQKAVENDNP